MNGDGIRPHNLVPQASHDHDRFDFVGNHGRLGLIQRKTFEKIVLESDNNVIYEYEFQLKVRHFCQSAPSATVLLRHFLLFGWTHKLFRTLFCFESKILPSHEIPSLFAPSWSTLIGAHLDPVSWKNSCKFQCFSALEVQKFWKLETIRFYSIENLNSEFKINIIFFWKHS